MAKRPIVFDCDTGTDDAIALVAALNSDKVEVRAITSVNGNVPEKYTSQNNLDLAEFFGWDVPVAHGAVKPMGLEIDNSHDNTHGATGLGSIVIPTAKVKKFDGRLAPQVIHDCAVEAKGELELVVTGPMTNIGTALLLYPDLPQLIKHIWFMGGACWGGNVTTTAEFNIWVDPEAAHVVMMSGIPMTMVGLDVTTLAIMLPEDADEIRAAGGPQCEFVADMLYYMFERDKKGGEPAMMHDALAFCAAVTDNVLTCKDYYTDTECCGTFTRGHTDCDIYHRTGKPANCSVALNIDVPAFRRWLVDAVKESANR